MWGDDLEWEYTTEDCVEGYETGSFGIYVHPTHVSGGGGAWAESLGVADEQANAYAVVALVNHDLKTLIRYEDVSDAKRFAALSVDYLSERGDPELSLSDIRHGPDGMREWNPDYIETTVEPEDALRRMVGRYASTVTIFNDN